MTMSLLADHNLPFAIALGLMFVLFVLQLIGIGDLDFDADLDFDVDVDGGVDLDADPTGAGITGAITTLLGLGRVPLFVWLMVFLLLFSLWGLSIQAFATDLIGGPLYHLLAALFAGGAALPVTSLAVRPLGKLIPQDETSAVGLDSLVGRRAKITTGRAAAGYPARAKTRDIHGHAHHVMVEPHENASEIHAGEEVLLVRREGQRFFAVPLSERKLSPME